MNLIHPDFPPLISFRHTFHEVQNPVYPAGDQDVRQRFRAYWRSVRIMASNGCHEPYAAGEHGPVCVDEYTARTIVPDGACRAGDLRIAARYRRYAKRLLEDALVYDATSREPCAAAARRDAREALATARGHLADITDTKSSGVPS